jgi:hypothetical protein
MLRDAMRGALAGAFATWLMDLVTTGIYAIHPPEVLEQEKAAQPNGKSSVTNLVDRLEALTGLTIPAESRATVENAVHYGLGVAPGAAYGVLRHYAPASRLGRGLAYGLVLFVVNDELMNASLGLSGPIDAYPPESHLRGLAGHAVLGVATETGIQILGG